MNLYVRLLDRMAARGLHQLPVVETTERVLSLLEQGADWPNL